MKTYELKEGEEWEEDALHHPPHFCPNCGEPMSKPISFWDDSSRESTVEHPFKGVGYDCYCSECHWSGDITPDVDQGIVEKRMKPSISFKKLR